MDYKQQIIHLLQPHLPNNSDLKELIIKTPDIGLGDYSLPCFRFSKELKTSPQKIAENLAAKLTASGAVEKIEAVSGYLNFTLNRSEVAKNTVSEITAAKELYGSSELGKGKTVCIDYSSINIAKPFHIGHLSTTVIGAALYRIYGFLGYTCVGINHLGDYGTQFGKLIVAYKKWGSRESVKEGRINEMLKLYVRFHEEEETNPSLTEEARAWFKKIENNDSEALELFNWFKELTLLDVSKIYELLGIQFDSYNGESFYNDKMQPVIEELDQKGLLKLSEGAKVVDLEEYNMPPCLIQKTDGASLYATRDIAAAFYRKQTYNFDKCLYVVAYQQNLHFKQFFKVIELMGKDFAKDLVHVAYGMVSLEDGGSMSSRKGNIVFLEEVIRRCIEKADKIIEEKNPSLENRSQIAKEVGLGAVTFSALINNRIKDIVFSYDRVLSFEGETAPYVQYTYARAGSVLSKAESKPELADFSAMTAEENSLITLLRDFPETVVAAAEKYEPSFVTRLTVDIAKAYNKFYFECRILGEEEGVMQKRLLLTECVRIVLKNGLKLLGISTPEKM